MRDSEAGKDREGGATSADPESGVGRVLWAAAFANLLIGLVGIVPALCVRWLLTKFPSADCGGASSCHGGTPDNPLGMITGAVLGGGFVVGMVLVVDLLMPRQEGSPVGPWLGMALLIPGPFVVGHAVGWF